MTVSARQILSGEFAEGAQFAMTVLAHSTSLLHAQAHEFAEGAYFAMTGLLKHSAYGISGNFFGHSPYFSLLAGVHGLCRNARGGGAMAVTRLNW